MYLIRLVVSSSYYIITWTVYSNEALKVAVCTALDKTITRFSPASPLDDVYETAFSEPYEI